VNAKNDDLSVSADVVIRFTIDNYCLWQQDVLGRVDNFRDMVREYLEDEGVILGSEEFEIISVEPLFEE